MRRHDPRRRISLVNDPFLHERSSAPAPPEADPSTLCWSRAPCSPVFRTTDQPVGRPPEISPRAKGGRYRTRAGDCRSSGAIVINTASVLATERAACSRPRARGGGVKGAGSAKREGEGARARAEGDDAPSVRRARPPRGWQRMVWHEPHWTALLSYERDQVIGKARSVDRPEDKRQSTREREGTDVEACENTVVIWKQPGHFTSCFRRAKGGRRGQHGGPLSSLGALDTKGGRGRGGDGGVWRAGLRRSTGLPLPS